jgi:NTE family protein
MRHDLRNIPFLGELTDEALAAISQRLRREHYHKGETVFVEGDYGDRMYIIESGQVKVVSDQEGIERIFSYLNPGNFFGETALLLGEPRSATVRVVIDAELLVLTQNDLEDLIRHYPSIALQISRELGRRLRHTTHTPAETEEIGIIAVIGRAAPLLARYIGQYSQEPVYLLDLGGLANVTLDRAALAEAQVVYERADEALETEALPIRLGELVQKYFWILLAVAPYETPLTMKAIDLADITAQLGREGQRWGERIAPRGLWHVADNDRQIRRLARRITRRLVGLALSSGNARGMAHIGVLKVLEANRIPIDMIAATSAGAVFGSQYAAGRSIREMTEFARNVQYQYDFRTGFRFWDVRFPPREGLIRGDVVLQYLRAQVYGKRFEDLETPLYVVATDVISGEEVVFDHGDVGQAVRASMSVIGIFEPTRVADRFLVDGGAVNPVPTGILADKGANIVIASNVIPSLQARLHRQAQRQQMRPPNVIGIVMGAMEIMESEIIKSRMSPVDVLIQPDVARYATLEYDKALEIIRAGEEAAAREVARIQQLLTPRPRRPESV